jgi:hypothetical protein
VSGGPASRTSGTFRQRDSLPEVRLTISRRNCEARWSAFGGRPASRTSGTFRQWDSLAEVRLAASRPGFRSFSGAVFANLRRVGGSWQRAHTLHAHLCARTVVGRRQHTLHVCVCGDRRRTAGRVHANRQRVREPSNSRRQEHTVTDCGLLPSPWRRQEHTDAQRVLLTSATGRGPAGGGVQQGCSQQARRIGGRGVAPARGRARLPAAPAARSPPSRSSPAPAATGRRDPRAPQARWTFMNAVENRRSRVRARQPYPGHGIPLPKGG